MDFLNQAQVQVKELLGSMTPAARITTFLLLGVIAVSIGYLFQHHSASPDAFLFNGEYLPARDVDRAEAAIAQARLTGYQRVGNRIKVPSAAKAEYLAAVADAGALPPNFHSLLENALELGPFTDRVTRQERLKAAREQQLSMIVRSMDGIEEAQVIYDIREPVGLSRVGQATASVNVRPSPGEPLDPRQAKMIKKAVAGAIAGLDLSHVTVTDLSDGSTYGGGGVSSASFENEYYQQRITYERLMKTNIEDLLHNVPGLRVQVAADLDDTIERTTRTVKPDGDAATIRQTEATDNSETSEIAPSGRPGPTANGPAGNFVREDAETIVKNKNEKSNSVSEFLNGQKDEFLRTAALVPTEVRVAISIPNNYLVDVWRERERKQGNDPTENYPDGTARDLIRDEIEKQVKTIVAPLLPKELARNERAGVEVQFFESLQPTEIEGPSLVMQALAWASKNFNTLAMVVVALFSLTMLRSLVKSIPEVEPTPALGGAALEVDADSSATPPTNEEETPGEQRPRLRLKKGDSLKDDLTEIVQEDPDAAAAILRSWISNAA